MILTGFIFLLAIQVDADSTSAQQPVQQQMQAGDSKDVEVQKEVVYQKETTVDLSGSNVEGENQLPPAFFLSRMQTPKAEGLLAERLRFSLRNYNDLGF